MGKWVMPISIKKYNIIEHLKKQDAFVWKAKKPFKKGDTVYVYIIAPVQEIRYKCMCVDENVSKETLDIHKYAKESGVNKYSMFKVIKEFSEGQLPWAELHANGLGQALLPSRVFTELDNYISSKE